MTSLQRGAVQLEVQGQPLTLHFAAAGRGAPLLLLHPSPLSAAFMAPAMATLKEQALCIAPDTPGYGDSDAFPEAPVDLLPYCDALAALLDALSLPQAAVYGSATGAQIAIEFAKAHPQRVSGVVLDNAAVFTDAERDRIMAGYFPDMTPRDDGVHLTRAWQVGHDLMQFFPWHQPAPAHRIVPAMPDARDTGPLAAMEATALGYLAAGPRYDEGYRVAFANERAEQVQQIEQPTVIVRWAGSILKPYTDRFDTVSFGPQVNMAFCDAEPAARWRCIAAHLPGVLPPATDAGLAPDQLATAWQDAPFFYCGEAGVQLRIVPVKGANSAPTSVILPPLGFGARAFAALLEAEGCDCAGFVVDLPGHGGSDTVASPSIEALAAALEARFRAPAGGNALATLVAFGSAGAIASRWAERDTRIETVRQEPWPPGGALRQTLPELRAGAGGGHLLEAWHWLRRQWLALDRPPPAASSLTAALVDLLRAAPTWSALMKEL